MLIRNVLTMVALASAIRLTADAQRVLFLSKSSSFEHSVVAPREDGGNLVADVLGSLAKEGDRVICKGLTVIGSICGDLIPARDLMAQGRIDAKALLSHEFPLDEINEAFRMAANPDESIKVVLKP